MTGKKIVWAIIAVAAVVVIVLVVREQRLQSIRMRRMVPIEGAVIQHDVDTKNQVPIADVVITASDGVTSAKTRSEASGFFRVVFESDMLSGKPIVVSFRHPEYEPLDLTVQTGNVGDSGEAVCCGTGSDRSEEGGSSQRSGGAGHQYPGEIHDQFPDGYERGQCGEDVSGGEYGQCAV